MAYAPTNTDLPLSNGIPGTYVKLDLSGAGSAADDSARRALLLGYRLSTGTYGPDTPVRLTNQSDVNTYFGRGSDLARLFAAFQSQAGSGAADVHLCGINAPSGTASTYLITVEGPATSAGSIDVWIAGYKASIGVANGDSANTIATNLEAAIDDLLDLPVTSGVAAPTITLTYRNTAIVGEDLPIICNVTGATGVKLSPGTITYANGATASGTITVVVGATTISASVTNLDSAATIGTAMSTAINAGSYPLTATDNGAGVVTFYYATDRAVRRITRSMGAVTGTTGTLAVGTTGAGTPTLTTALTNIGAQPAYGTWLTSFNETTSLGTIATHIDTNANGVNQKGQAVHFGSAAALATAGALPTGASPALTATSRFMLSWCVDSPQQAYEIAARSAATYLDQNYAAHNYDGDVLRSRTPTVPLLVTHPNSRPSLDDQNAAIMTYFMTPVVVDAQNRYAVLRGRTTSNDANQDLWEWSFVKQLDSGRSALRTRLTSLFTGKSLKTSGTPKTPNTITTSSVSDAIFVFLRELDDQDLFDDADAVKDAIAVSQNGSVPTRLDVFVPWAVIRPLHQLAAVISPR